MGRRLWSWYAAIVLSGNLACAIAGSHAKSIPPAAPAGVELVYVKGGCFRMGNVFEAGGPEEKPVHEVCVDDFYIGKYEVTRDEWREIMGTPAQTSNPACGSRCPVEMVSWDDAQEFVAKLNARDGARSSGQYRLPTEAEWEYAARSGGKDELYAGAGSDVDGLAWHFWNEGVTHAVGLKAPNGLGLYDMSGNVWEWTSDWYGETYYAASPRLNPTGPASGERRVLRGGSASCPPFDLRTSYRNYLPPSYRGAGKGLRVVKTIPTKARTVALANAGAPPASGGAPSAGGGPSSIDHAPLNDSTLKDPTTGMEFVAVKGGCFQMGDLYGDVVEGDEESAALPVHEVCVHSFYIGKYEVTVGQWRYLMSTEPSSLPTCKVDTCPVDNVTYRDVQEFIRRLNAKDGAAKYRLPTEAEWEYAARSGGKVERYSGGNDVESVSWYACLGDTAEPCYHPVGTKLPNGLGIYDMSGNVYEITSDWLNPTYYSTSPRDDPRGPESGEHRVKRGGCGNGGPRNSRTARRNYFSDPNPMTGFRLLRIP